MINPCGFTGRGMRASRLTLSELPTRRRRPMDMLLVRMLSYALLMHETLYLCRDGSNYLMRSFLPTLGLRLTPRAYMMLHTIFIGVCVWLLFIPQAWWLYPVLLVILSLVIASYSLRVSNHLILSWFMVLTLCVATYLQAPHERGLRATNFLLLGVQGLCILTYFFSFLHKLNSDYISLRHSCATQLGDFYCWDRKIEHKGMIKAVCLLSIYGTLVVEGLMPVCLLVPQLLPLGLLLGLTFHFTLGLLGIINFSTVMYAGLLTFLPPPALVRVSDEVAALGWPTIALCSILCLLMVWFLTPRYANRYCPYVKRWPAWILQSVFGVISALLLVGGFCLFRIEPFERVSWSTLDRPEQLLLLFFLLAFSVNGLSPYLGLKTEFSFAMFSNLRYEPWRHLLYPSSWRPFNLSSYVEIKRLEGLPDSNQVRETSATKMVLFLLSQAESYRFSSYFFRESIRLICRAAETPPRIHVVFIERGKRFEIDDFDGRFDNGWLTSLRVSLFPFMMPLDPDAPHSEQGTVRKQDERQMF
jgi:hypothetical protein